MCFKSLRRDRSPRTDPGTSESAFRARSTRHTTSSRAFPAAILGILAVAWSVLAASNCYVCGRPFYTVVYEVTDRWDGMQREICDVCTTLTRRCSVCLLPVDKDYREVPDGRSVCRRHETIVVFEEKEARTVLAAAREEMNRSFARFTRFPATNVHLNFADQIHMSQLVNRPGFERQCPFIYGYTRSVRLRGGSWDHPIWILSALPKSQLIGTYVHEVAHTWVKENLPEDRKIAQSTEEGFCELVAYRVLSQLGETQELGRILRNNYTRGQIELFVEANKIYDFQRIIDWMKHGRHYELIRDRPDSIRDLAPARSTAASRPVSPPPPLALPSAPEELTLISVLSSSAQHLALVNNTTLAAGDRAKVRVGTNLLTVQCIEVRSNAVVLELPDEGRRVELELRRRSDE